MQPLLLCHRACLSFFVVTMAGIMSLSPDRNAHALQVIGENRVVVQGGTVTLPCKLIDTTEDITQISWKRKTRGKPQNDNFFTIQPKNGPQFVNGKDDRFKFVGSIKDNNGTLQISDVTLLDEGVYTCIFTFFRSGHHKREILLDLIVPPVTSITDNRPILGNEEVCLASCTAAGSRPPSDVKWATGTLTEKVRATIDSTKHDNGTTTTVSLLFGVPTKEINHHSIRCLINTTSGLLKEETLPFTVQVYFSPLEVSISERSPDSFECVAEANPNANFTWSRSGQVWPQSAARAEGSKLHLLSISSELNGLYQCEASNMYGRKYSHLYVHVTSGTCTVCWTLFGLLLFLLLGAAAAWYLYKSRNSQRTGGGTRQEMQRVPTDTSPHEEQRGRGGGEEEE